MDYDCSYDRNTVIVLATGDPFLYTTICHLVATALKCEGTTRHSLLKWRILQSCLLFDVNLWRYFLGATNKSKTWAVVVVQWSALSPTAPKIRVQIRLATKCSLLYKKTKINKKEAGVGPFVNFF